MENYFSLECGDIAPVYVLALGVRVREVATLQLNEFDLSTVQPVGHFRHLHNNI